MKYTAKEFKKLFIENNEETALLKERVEKNFNLPNNYPTLEDNDKFINWYFPEHDWYIKEIYLKVSSGNFDKTIPYKGDEYINICLFKKDESNIECYIIYSHNLIISNFKPMYTIYLNKEEAIKAFNDLNEDIILNSFQMEKYIDKLKTRIKTDCNFYGNYKNDKGEDEIELYFYQEKSNIDLYTILLSGTDDYSLSKDFLNEEEAQKEVDRLVKNGVKNIEELKEYYFSN